MKRKLLLSFLSIAVLTAAQAQKKSKRTTAYAITGAERGGHRWTEVNLVDATTGEIISPVYQSKSEVKRLNARTGKPITIAPKAEQSSTSFERIQSVQSVQPATRVKLEEGIVVVKKVQPTDATVITTANGGKTTITGTRTIIINNRSVQKEDPFATTSAACAFDAKHDRLYYTPMGINQLRYIDLKSKEPSVYYFEEEAFGSVTGMGDVNNQITRMVIAADGKGYALTNDANQLIQFTTKKKPVITNLGAITDDPSNGKFSVHSRSAYGGDMVADDKNNLYLVTANRRVYRISLETKVATYLGSIKGLPDGFTTNGAVVESDTKIIVSSSQSTQGYFRFDVENMQAEKLTTSAVFNASDLANDRLLSIKKKKEEKPELAQQEVLANEALMDKAVQKSIGNEAIGEARMSVYPNPVTNANTKISLANYPEGRYNIQLYDLSGRLVNQRAIQVNNKVQVIDYNLPSNLAKGSYFVQITNASNIITSSEKIIVQ
jgi:hypothetical protein